MSELNFGLKECSKCEYNLRCQECIYQDVNLITKMQERVKAQCRELFSGFDVCMIVDQIAEELRKEIQDAAHG